MQHCGFHLRSNLMPMDSAPGAQLAHVSAAGKDRNREAAHRDEQGRDGGNDCDL